MGILAFVELILFSSFFPLSLAAPASSVDVDQLHDAAPSIQDQTRGVPFKDFLPILIDGHKTTLKTYPGAELTNVLLSITTKTAVPDIFACQIFYNNERDDVNAYRDLLNDRPWKLTDEGPGKVDPSFDFSFLNWVSLEDAWQTAHLARPNASFDQVNVYKNQETDQYPIWQFWAYGLWTEEKACCHIHSQTKAIECKTHCYDLKGSNYAKNSTVPVTDPRVDGTMRKRTEIIHS